MNHNLRTTVVNTGEVMVNLNDLIIKLIMMANDTASTSEAKAIHKIVEMLSHQRDLGKIKGSGK